MSTNIKCATGVNIPVLTSEPCNGEYVSDSCIIHPQSITALNLPINSNVNSVINSLVLAIQHKEEQIVTLQNQITALTPTYTSYVINVKQTATNPPVITELVNTTGKTFTPLYEAVGSYQILPNTQFLITDEFETLSNIKSNIGTQLSIDVNYQNIKIYTNDITNTPIDGVLNATIRINIYP